MDGFYELPLLLAAVTVHALVLIGISSRHRRSNHPVLRFLLSGLSAVYFPLIYYVLSQMPTFLSSMLSRNKGDDNDGSNDNDKEDDGMGDLNPWMWFMIVVWSLILIQFLKAKADMAALAVAAVTSPVAGDDIDSLKIRPSIDSLISYFWVAGLVIFSFIRYADELIAEHMQYSLLVIVLLWILGAQVRHLPYGNSLLCARPQCGAHRWLHGVAAATTATTWFIPWGSHSDRREE